MVMVLIVVNAGVSVGGGVDGGDGSSGSGLELGFEHKLHFLGDGVRSRVRMTPDWPEQFGRIEKDGYTQERGRPEYPLSLWRCLGCFPAWLIGSLSSLPL